MNWKAIQITSVLIILLVILAFIRSGSDFDIRSIIPFMSGRDIGIHDWAGLVLLIMIFLGIRRLRRRAKAHQHAERHEPTAYEIHQQPPGQSGESRSWDEQ